jgi:hypothetical protein
MASEFQTPGNYPEESIQHSEHDESLKSRSLRLLLVFPEHITLPQYLYFVSKFIQDIVLWTCYLPHTLVLECKDPLAQYLLKMMPMALLTENSEDKIFKTGIYFQHPFNSTKYISFELHQLWQWITNETHVPNFTYTFCFKKL